MPGRFNVYVFEDDGIYYVRPAVAMVSRTLDADGIRIRNLTGHTVEVHLPDPIRLGEPHIPIAPGTVGTIAFRGDADGIFDYCVDVVLDPHKMVKAPARGNSFPKIIVDP
jgi:hypothetical protein